MEETQRRVKNAVDDLIDNLDRDILRDKQRKAFLCSADCCNSTGSRTTIETCVDSCNKSMQKAHTVLETELAALQQQMSRCAMSCYDKLVQQMGPDPSKYSEAQMHQFNEKIDHCVSKCADDHVRLLPQIKSRLYSSLKD
uniref:Protein FAM136A n=1 Tax=Panagrolaimus sp. ES5 TaxID=591445 RepID=A0AC34FC67_9BILA